MIKINLYNFNKRENSARRPTGTGTEYDIAIKEPCGMLSPTIMLNLGLANAPTFNYAKIDAFNRYYYVGEWIFERGCWTAQLEVDVLASANTYIGDHDLYVLRSSAESDGRVFDSMYPTIAKVNSYKDDMGVVTVSKMDGSMPASVVNYFDRPLGLGRYYIGVVGPNATGVTYYVMTSSAFNNLTNQLANFVPSGFDDVSEGVSKQLANPLQFITSCFWLPVEPNGLIHSTQNLNFGYYTIPNITCAEVNAVSDIFKSSATFTIRKHPQASTRGVYLNSAPYTQYTLNFNPFGSFQLDASLMVSDTTLTCEWYIDYTSGLSDLVVRADNSLLVNTQSQFAVPIQLNQATVDMIGMTKSVGGGILEAGVGLLTGNIGGAIMGGLSAINGFHSTKSPKITSIGGGGNFIPFATYVPKLYTDFYYIADEYNDEIGRPLCKVRKPKNIKGYIKALDGSIQAPFTQEELQKINEYLTGGFYFYD